MLKLFDINFFSFLVAESWLTELCWLCFGMLPDRDLLTDSIADFWIDLTADNTLSLECRDIYGGEFLETTLSGLFAL